MSAALSAVTKNASGVPHTSGAFVYNGDKGMSTNLYWTPVVDTEAECLSETLKYTARHKYGSCIDVELNSHDIPYFEGLRDAGVKDAQKIIDAINEYRVIKIWEEA